MKEFTLADVVEFLKANIDTIFDYGMPRKEVEVCCAMSSFFRSKGIDFNAVSCDGEYAERLESEEKWEKMAHAELPARIGNVHLTGRTLVNGGEILQNMVKEGWIEKF